MTEVNTYYSHLFLKSIKMYYFHQDQNNIYIYIQLIPMHKYFSILRMAKYTDISAR